MSPSVSFTFVNAGNVNASDHNRNYADAVLALSDGNTDHTVASVIANGTVTVDSTCVVNGNLTNTGMLTSNISFAANKDAGSTSNRFGSLKTSDGIYLSSGKKLSVSSSNIRSDYSEYKFDRIKNAMLTGTGTLTASGIVNIQSHVQGKRMSWSITSGVAAGDLASPSGDRNIVGLLAATDAVGFYMPFSGSLTEISYYVTLNPNINTTLTFKIYKNTSVWTSVGTSGVILTKSSSGATSGNLSYTANDKTFSQGDTLFFSVALTGNDPLTPSTFTFSAEIKANA